MTLIDFYNSTRSKYLEITEKADKLHIERYDDLDPHFAYSWFESLANALNAEMIRSEDAGKYKNLFEYISSNLTSGDEDVKNCIDVSFVENLFWKVPSAKAKPYWKLLPLNLRKLYVNFHNKEPL